MYITPPLTPISSPIEYFTTDEAITSDVSDLSSRMSEALEEAEGIVNKESGDIWPAEATYSLNLSEETPPFEDVQIRPMSPAEISSHKVEDELPLEPYPDSSASQQEQSLKDIAADNKSESQLAEPFVNDLGAEESIQPTSNDRLLEFQYEELSAEDFFYFDINALVVAQAKLPIPDTEMESEYLEWETAASDPIGMFQWIKESNDEAFQIQEWTASKGHHEYYTSTHSSAETDFDLQSLEQFQGDTSMEEKLHAFLPDAMPFDHTCLINSDWHREQYSKTEEFLEESVDESGKSFTSTDESAWYTMIQRRKRRKLDYEESRANHIDQETPRSFNRRVEFKAPELLLGVNAFSHLRVGGQQATKPKQGKSAIYRNEDDVLGSDVGTATEILLPCPPINAIVIPYKLIFSAAIPLPLRTHILHLFPDLEFVERDYQNRRDHGVAYDEADIVSLSTGIVMTTMVGFRQSGGSQKMSAFQQRVVKMSGKYEKLCILIYRSQRLGVDGGGMSEFSPSDAMAFAQLQGLAHNLVTDISILYISGGEKMVAQWVVSLLCMEQPIDGARTGALLVELETPQELFLRRAGMNVYDAQVVLGLLEESGKGVSTQSEGSISRFVAMSPDERRTLFGPHIGCQRALEKVISCISQIPK